jgi:hypothetical protein
MHTCARERSRTHAKLHRNGSEHTHACEHARANTRVHTHQSEKNMHHAKMMWPNLNVSPEVNCQPSYCRRGP